MQIITFSKTIFFSLVSLSCSAQLITNGTFDNWTNGDPVGWATNNIENTNAGQNPTVTQITGSATYSGTGSSMSVETIAGVGQYAGQIIRGRATFIDEPGIYAQRISFDYKNQLVGTSDSALVVVRWVDVSQQLVAAGLFYMTTDEASSEWKSKTIGDADYVVVMGKDFSQAVRIQIDVYSAYVKTAASMTAGSKIMIDNIKYAGRVFGPHIGLNEKSNKEPVIYPNPAKESMTILGNTPIKKIRIYSSSGQFVSEMLNTKTIPVGELVKGYYFVEVTEENGRQMNKSFFKE